MKCAVLLSGCGFQDGTEIQEAVFCLASLEKFGVQAVPLSLNQAQRKVVGHYSQSELKETRNLLEESARICRGGVENLVGFDLSGIDMLILPGGFGAALNLSDFALKGSDFCVHPEVEKLIRHCYEESKPIGSVCIAPCLVAKVLGGSHPALTVGDHFEIEKTLESFGAKMKKCQPGECVVDPVNKLASTPAYMYEETSLQEVSSGIEKMVKALCEL